jgi:predicted transcriptional regulator
MKTELKKDVYKIIENGEHINTLDATERIVKLAEDYSTKKMIEHINYIIDNYLLDNISLRALQNKRSELYNLKNK